MKPKKLLSLLLSLVLSLGMFSVSFADGLKITDQTPEKYSFQVDTNSTYVLFVKAEGDPYNYQWYRDKGSGFLPILGANSSLYEIDDPDASYNGFRYKCVVSKGASETVESKVITLVLQKRIIPDFSVMNNGFPSVGEKYESDLVVESGIQATIKEAYFRIGGKDVTGNVMQKTDHPQYYVRLKAKEGYAFKDGLVVTHWPGNADCTNVKKISEDEYEFVWDFKINDQGDLEPIDETAHTITVDNGTADKSTAKAGETVTISAEPAKENFTFTGWTAYTDDARSVSFADRLSPNTTFIMPDCDVRMMPNYKYSGSVFTDFYVNITPPAPGEHPQAPIVNIDDYSVSAYNWIETTDTGSSSVSRKMTSSDVFKEGIFYQCRVDLLVKDGIVGEADELKGYVNGSTKTDGMDVMISRNGSFKVKVIGSYNCHSAKANPFVDVSESDYFYEPVLWAVDKGITNGTDATHFSPAATCTRGQVVTFLWRAAGSPKPTSTTNPFTDVTSSDYYYNAVLWAVGKNITNGTSATTFGPNDGCTRGQVVTFLHRFENSPKPSSTANPFVDVSSSEYYYNPVLWAVGKGITNGTDATHFSPNDTCTRGQIVTFLYRDMK